MTAPTTAAMLTKQNKTSNRLHIKTVMSPTVHIFIHGTSFCLQTEPCLCCRYCCSSAWGQRTLRGPRNCSKCSTSGKIWSFPSLVRLPETWCSKRELTFRGIPTPSTWMFGCRVSVPNHSQNEIKTTNDAVPSRIHISVTAYRLCWSIGNVP
jgi:hypothetical protein